VPYRLGQINHPHLAGTQWLPFYTLYLLRAMRDGRRQSALMATLFLILTALVGWNLFLYLLIWTAWIGGYSWLTQASPLRRLLPVIGGIVLLGGLVLAPLLAPLLAGGIGDEHALGDVQQEWMQTDLTAYVLPNRFHPLWGRTVTGLYDRMVRPQRVVYLGYAVMALLGYGLFRRGIRRRTGLWWSGMLLWWLMALGPFLKLSGHVYRTIPLPYYVLSRLYAFQILKIPDRYNLMLSLPAAVMVGYAVADLLRLLRTRLGNGLLAALSVLTLFEYLSVPVNMQEVQVPAFYRRMARDAGEFGVVELPIDFYDAAKRYLLYQTVHGHPIVEGHVSRRPPEAVAYLDTHPLLRSLYRTQEIGPDLNDVSRQLGTLWETGFRYIIVHKQFTDAGRVTDWRHWLAIAPLFEGQDLIVYNVQPRYGQNFGFAQDAGDGIGLIESALSATTLHPEGWLEAKVVWGTKDAPERDWSARLGLISPLGTEVEQVDFEPCEGWPTSAWGADAIARGFGALRVDPFIEGGTYTVTVGLIDPTTGARAGTPLDVGQVEIQAAERVFEQPVVEFPVEAVFGDSLELLGYDWQQDSQAIRLVLHWQARRRIPISYKFFAHILDHETGELVAQADVMPRNWTYPTTWWEEGEVVSDEIALAVSNVPPGQYRLIVGAYDPETGTRLTITNTGLPARTTDHLPLIENLVLP
jgi:hypothetical protein